jgi:hypothetical protein
MRLMYGMLCMRLELLDFTLLSLLLSKPGVFNSTGRISMNIKKYVHITCLKGKVSHPAPSVIMVSKNQILTAAH